MSMQDLTERQQLAAFHGLATNPSLCIEDRLKCALKALKLAESELEAMDARLAAYEPGSDQ